MSDKEEILVVLVVWNSGNSWFLRNLQPRHSFAGTKGTKKIGAIAVTSQVGLGGGPIVMATLVRANPGCTSDLEGFESLL
eukprot:CAMPEP_0181337240 /NCGR_PEP_ID=MMETSP1101-20121128/27899_1 /TAXON_ID=46948 /ORGANISM="Rhodomonas abbreviata, Strain Caron Lab Isolate" /LENGTH=79 /DNA_ID=CAMNT_0023447693 /DNA_START=1214 /DNA_END=1453 /DNA_ORIENTATION=-